MEPVLRVAAIQMSSRPDRDVNLADAADLIAQAVDQGATLVALPEMFNLLGDRATLREGAEPLDGPTQTWAAARAREHGINLLAGSMIDRKSTRLNSSHIPLSRMPSSA